MQQIIVKSVTLIKKSAFSETRFSQEEYYLLDKTFDRAHVLTMKCKIRFQ